MTAVWVAVSVLVIMLVMFIHHLAMIMVARGGGVRAVEAAIGMGPTLFRFRLAGVPWLIKLLPITGYTKFRGMEDEDEDPRSPAAAPLPDDIAASEAEAYRDDVGHEAALDAEENVAGENEATEHQGSLYDASLGRQVSTMLAGPATNIAIGLLFLWLPIAASRPQLVFDPAQNPKQTLVDAASHEHPDESPSKPAASPAASWQGQRTLLGHTAGHYLKRLLLFQSLEGWGGYVAAAVTLGRVNEVSIWHGLSLLGVLFLVMGLMNLLPFPSFIGFHVMTALLTGGRKPAPSKQPIQTTLVLVGLLVWVVYTCRVVWLDVRWVFNL